MSAEHFLAEYGESRAVCSCGWRSMPVATRELANQSFNYHLAQSRRGVR